MLKEVAPGWTTEEVEELAGAELAVSPGLKEMGLQAAARGAASQ